MAQQLRRANRRGSRNDIRILSGAIAESRRALSDIVRLQLDDGGVLDLNVYEANDSFKIPIGDGQAIEIVPEYETDDQREETFKIQLDDGEEFEIPGEFDQDELAMRAPSAPLRRNTP